MRVANLLESFDSTYQYWKITPYSYLFDTEDGYEYDVLVEGDGSIGNPMEFLFVIIDKDTRRPMRKYDSRLLANSSHPIKVLSTVVHIAMKHVEKYKPDSFMFSGEKQLGNVYQQIIKRKFQNSEYTMRSYHKDSGMTFVFIKKTMEP